MSGHGERYDSAQTIRVALMVLCPFCSHGCGFHGLSHLTPNMWLVLVPLQPCLNCWPLVLFSCARKHQVPSASGSQFLQVTSDMVLISHHCFLLPRTPGHRGGEFQKTGSLTQLPPGLAVQKLQQAEVVRGQRRPCVTSVFPSLLSLPLYA